MTDRCQRLISGSLIVVLTLFSAGVVCVLPCGLNSAATAAADATPETHCQKAASSGPTASIAASSASCSDSDGLAPAIGNGVRRTADMAAGHITVVERATHAVAFHPIGAISTSSPPGSTRRIPISAPLRI